MQDSFIRTGNDLDHRQCSLDVDMSVGFDDLGSITIGIYGGARVGGVCDRGRISFSFSHRKICGSQISEIGDLAKSALKIERFNGDRHYSFVLLRELRSCSTDKLDR